jgi:hypothetical protein
VTELDPFSWAVGILEGEGSFGIDRQQGRAYLRIQVSSVDREVLERLRLAFGRGNVIGPYWYGNEKHKPLFFWRLNRQKEVESVMKAILPHMSERRRLQIASALNARECNKI